MKKIDAKEKSLTELLQSKKYLIDYYQREYRWENRQVVELIGDLVDRFCEDYKEGHSLDDGKSYGCYFLGSILFSQKENDLYIVDGQQRLTTITLLLMYLYNALKEVNKEVQDLPRMIFSESRGTKSFNINVDERNDCFNAIFRNQEDEFSTEGKNESVKNLIARYKDIKNFFIENNNSEKQINSENILHFTWWLIENVYLVEIKTYSDDDAYTIFETMNDRGLNLDNTEMLKGYLLANAKSENRDYLDKKWKGVIRKLEDIEKEEVPDFFKNWFRGKYAITSRERNKDDKGYKNQDFEIIGNAYHKWIKDNKKLLELNDPINFYDFIEKDLDFYSNVYLKLREKENKFDFNYQELYFNIINNFTLQKMLILAPINTNDNEEIKNKKIKLVSAFLDIYIARNIVNFRVLGYSAVSYKIFNYAKSIRKKSLEEVYNFCISELNKMPETFNAIDSYRLHQQNRNKVHYILARITYFIESSSGISSKFEEYMNKGNAKPYEIEHIIPDDYEKYKNEFSSEDEFETFRNKPGNLILIQRGTNQSLGANTFQEKQQRYSGENVLAQSLCENCYISNPNFVNFKNQNQFDFKAYTSFGKNEIIERTELYKKICNKIWDINNLKKLIE